MPRDERESMKITKLVGSSNYRVWKREREAHAKSKGYFRLLVEYPRDLKTADPTKAEVPVQAQAQDPPGDDQPPPVLAAPVAVGPTKEEREEVEKDVILDGKAVYALTLNVSPTIRLAIDPLEFAADIWAYLGNTYGLLNQTAIDTLLARFYSLWMPTARVSAVFATVNDLVAQLSAAGHMLDDATIGRQILKLLAQSTRPRMVNYVDQVRAQIRKDGAMAVEELETLFHDMELELDELEKADLRDRRQNVRSTVHPGEAVAYQAAPPRNFRRQSPRTLTPRSTVITSNQQINSPRGVCYRCRQPGHHIKDCPQTRQALLSDGCTTVALRPDTPQVVTHGAHRASSMPKELIPRWVHDTGATAHMTSYRGDFSSIETITPPLMITGIEGRFVEATHVGTVQVKLWDGSTPCGMFQMTDVLFVPDLNVRLYSAGAAAREGYRSCVGPECSKYPKYWILVNLV